MRRFHNPVTKLMVIIIVAMALTLAVFLLVIADDTPPLAFFIAFLVVAVFTLIAVWGERKYRKLDAQTSEETGESYNTAADVYDMIRHEPRKTVIIAIGATVGVIGGFVALFIYNPWIGVPLYIVFCLVLVGYPLYKSKKSNTVETYISSKRGAVKSMLQDIHRQTMEAVPNAVAFMDNTFVFPTYVYIESMQPLVMYHLISVQAIWGGKNICLYPRNPAVFQAFADRLTSYQNNGSSEIFIPTNQLLDRDLIKDIVRYNLEQQMQGRPEKEIESHRRG